MPHALQNIESGMRKRWQFDHQDPNTQSMSLMDRLLHNRGLDDPQTASLFLNPKLSQLHDPVDIPNLDRAAKRIKQAIHDQQPIVIYGDYDVDGITASAILWHMLTLAGACVRTYTPHRIEEGYGLNNEAIETLCQANPLIISVDCGITAIEPAAIAKAQGVDLIITDHHEMDPDDLPDAYALVHPRLPGSTYPFGDLCGAGVAFKLAWQFAKVHCGSERLPNVYKDLMVQLVSLAALGTVADMVPLVDENRIITTFGLHGIKHTKMLGLNALIDASKLRDEKIDAMHVGFCLGPRLNAAGRMGHAKDAVRLLTEADRDQAIDIAQFLTRENEARRRTEREITQLATEQVTENGYDHPDSRMIVVAGEDWHPGVVGIVASRLVEAFSRPAIVMNIDGDEVHGSARSVEGINIHEALTHCKDHLLTFGGHAMAAGLRLRIDQLDAFRQTLCEFINERLAEEDLSPMVKIEATCSMAELSLDQVRQIERMAPFGQNNPTPVLCIRQVTIARPPMRMGQAGKHLRIPLQQGACQRTAVAFSMGDLADQLPAGAVVDIAFKPKTNTWQGRTSVDLMIEDIKISSS